jgi:hypothetical protein
MEYVSYYDNIFTQEYCQELIDKFEANPDQQESTDMENHRHFKEINISQYPNWTSVHDTLVDTMQKALVQYKLDNQIDDKVWPQKIGCEMFRMKRYLPNGNDEFKFHVDVGDYASARRFLVFFWYLNDVEEGGETTFQKNRASPVIMSVKPVAGRMIVFPPLWTFPHTGEKPVSGPKYIIGGYLHYL